MAEWQLNFPDAANICRGGGGFFASGIDRGRVRERERNFYFKGGGIMKLWSRASRRLPRKKDFDVARRKKEGNFLPFFLQSFQSRILHMEY